MQQISLQIKILRRELDHQRRKMHLAEQGNDRLMGDLVHIQKELNHQIKDREKSQAELEHKTLRIEKEQVSILNTQTYTPTKKCVCVCVCDFFPFLCTCLYV